MIQPTTLTSTGFSRENNFDIIRYVAALEVVIVHSAYHLKMDGASWIIKLLTFFPGVPIFFVVSGFLISASWERSPNIKKYAVNRALRIFPALSFVFVFSVMMLAVSGFITASTFIQPWFWAWFATQISFLQFYNPAAFNTFGIGTVNGSLWTIPVETTFYVALPVLMVLFSNRKYTNLLYAACAVISIALFMRFKYHIGDTTAIRLLFAGCIPYLWMFILGVLMQINFQRLKPWLVGKAWLWLTIYLAWCLFSSLTMSTFYFHVTPTFNTLPQPILLSILVISAAFSGRLVPKIYEGNDISYGMYLFHMPIMNFLIHYKWNGWTAVALLVAATHTMAIISWLWIEKPAIDLKKKFAG